MNLHCKQAVDRVFVQDIKLQDDFGFAPSTLIYKGSEALLGKAKI